MLLCVFTSLPHTPKRLCVYCVCILPLFPSSPLCLSILALRRDFGFKVLLLQIGRRASRDGVGKASHCRWLMLSQTASLAGDSGKVEKKRAGVKEPHTYVFFIFFFFLPWERKRPKNSEVLAQIEDKFVKNQKLIWWLNVI